MVLLTGCQDDRSAGKSGYKLAWYHGSCVAINEGLQSDNHIFLVTNDQNYVEVIARGKASEESCAPLIGDRGQANLAEGYVFYQVRSVSGLDLKEENLGVVVVTTEKNITQGLDVNDNGMSDKFSYCTTSEGMNFYAWDDKTGEQKPFWQEYYYLGYEVESSCKFAAP
ncbi:hypothetical protein [Kangiella marina]